VNPGRITQTFSFELTTFDVVEDNIYYIDQIDSGLVVEVSCNYPCLTCDEPSECTSCDPNDILGRL